jgi:hypothetical protein
VEVVKAGKWRAALVILIFLSAGYGVAAITNHTSDLYYDNYVATYWVNSTSTKATNYYVGAQTLHDYILATAPGGSVNGTAIDVTDIDSSSYTLNGADLNARFGGDYGALDITTTGDIEGTNVNATTEFYRAGTSLTDLLAAAGGGSLIKQAAPYTYIVWRDGATYHANSTIGGTNYNNANFVTLMGSTIGACSAGDVIFIKAGTYVVGTTITGKSGVSIIGSGSGTIFDCTSMASGDHAIDFSGTESDVVAVSVNVVAGEDHVHVADSSGYVHNDLFMIYSSDVWRSSPYGTLQGEIHYVDASAANVITLRTPTGTSIGYDYFYDSYAAAHSSIKKIIPVSNVIVEGIYFLGTAANHLRGINVGWGENFVVRNCIFKLMVGEAVSWVNCINSVVEDNKFIECNEAGNGYGVGLGQACQNIRVSGNRGETCGHMVAIGSGAAVGVPRSIFITDNTAMNCVSAAFNVHFTGEHISINNNIIIGGEVGIMPFMYSGIVSNNQIFNTKYGIEIDASSVGDGVLISGNKIKDCWNAGIISSSSTRKDVFQGNYVTNCLNGMQISDNTAGVVINGNQLEDNIYCGLFLTTVSNAIIENNLFRGNSKVTGNQAHIELDTNSDNNLIINNIFRQGANTERVEECIYISSNTCNNNVIKDNDMEKGDVYYVLDSGTDTTFNELFVPFVGGTTFLSAVTAGWGWEIDATTEYAAGFIKLPSELKETRSFMVQGNSIVTEADGMQLQLITDGGADNEGFNNDHVDVTKTSSTLNLAANDYVQWKFLPVDDADIDDYIGGDTIMFKILWSDVSGGNCATDAVFHGAIISYLK